MNSPTPCYRLELDVDDIEATTSLYGPTDRAISALLTDGESCTSALVPVSEMLVAAWIPVGHALPAPREDVLVALTDAETGEHVVEAGWLHTDGRWRLLSAEDTVLYGHQHVTHWMPWPAHPAATGEAEEVNHE